MTSPSVRRSLMRAEDESITLKEKACRPVWSSSSMSHDRTGQPVVGRDTSHEPGYEIQRQNSDNEQIRTLLDRQREQILADCQAETENTNSRLIMSEEVCKNQMKRSSRSRKNFIVLKQKNAVDKIINFFMNRL